MLKHSLLRDPRTPAFPSYPFTSKLHLSFLFASSFLSSVQSLSCAWLFATPWTAACQDSLSITNSWSLLKLMSIESVMPSNHLILCHPLRLLPSIFPSIRVFSWWVCSLHQVAKVLEFQLQHQSFQWIFRTDFFTMDWLDLLAVQGTLKSLLQHHSSKASILQCSAFLWFNSHIHTWLLEKNHSFDYTDLCQQSDVLTF